MSGDAPHFLIVEDHALFRVGLGMMLAQAWPLATLREACTLAQALAQLQDATVRPDLILLDICLPDGDGLAHVPALQAAAPGVPVLAMSADLSADAVSRARAQGVAGCLPKAAAVEAVQATVREVLAGRPAFGLVPYEALQPLPGSQHAWAAVASDQVAAQAWVAGFRPNDTQRLILTQLGHASTNKAIARQLGLSEMQVRAEMSWLTEVLDARSRRELYQRACDRGWVRPC